MSSNSFPDQAQEISLLQEAISHLGFACDSMGLTRPSIHFYDVKSFVAARVELQGLIYAGINVVLSRFAEADTPPPVDLFIDQEIGG